MQDRTIRASVFEMLYFSGKKGWIIIFCLAWIGKNPELVRWTGASVISIILHFSPLGCICKTKNHNFAGLTGLPSQQKCLQLSLPLSQFQHCKIIGIIGRPRKQLVLSLLHSWELYALTCLRATYPQRPHTSAAAIQKAQKTYASGSTKQPLHFTGSPFS